MKRKKVVYPNYLLYFFLSAMHKVIGEIILSNNFFKTA